MPASLVQFENVSLIREETALLEHISFKVYEKEHWVILGPNGAGKSTLSALLCAYLWPSSGSAKILGAKLGRIDTATLRRSIAFFHPMLQEALLSCHEKAGSAWDIIDSGKEAVLPPYHAAKKASRQKEELLSPLLSFPAEGSFRQLSCGEKRKTMLLRCMMTKAQLLILDEPYSSLDIASYLELEGLLMEILMPKKKKDSCNNPKAAKMQLHRPKASITVLHRVEEIAPFCTHVLLLKKGRVLAQGELAETLCSQGLSELYEIPLSLSCKRGRYTCMPAATRRR